MARRIHVQDNWQAPAEPFLHPRQLGFQSIPLAQVSLASLVTIREQDAVHEWPVFRRPLWRNMVVIQARHEGELRADRLCAFDHLFHVFRREGLRIIDRKSTRLYSS